MTPRPKPWPSCQRGRSGGLPVTRVLDALALTRGLPQVLRTDNGLEFCGRAMLTWAHARGVRLRLIQPGKPTQNAYIESFDGRFRDECLNEHWFTSLAHAQVVIETGRREYNEERPKKGLGGLTPAVFPAVDGDDEHSESNRRILNGSATQTGWTSRASRMSAGRSNVCFVMHAQFPLPICRRAREFGHGFKLLVLTVALTAPVVAVGQESQSRPPDVHEHVAVKAPMLTPTREASGTAWLPDITPMYGVHRPWRGWDVRLDGVGFVEALYEPLDRHRTGGSSTRQVAGINWGMAMARRRLGGGRFGIRSMLSAEPWTLTSCGALNLLAIGEVCDGDTVHDRQQPHDLFMELAVDYERPLHGPWKWQVYAGLAGEPALGPPGYPHRASAIVNPIRPVAHHWLDSTHVTFGVVTLAFHNQRWKVEASTFNGREADERRVDLDLGTFDSAAARLSFLPSERLAFQVSAARLREVGTDFPLPSQPPVVRATASAMYHVPLGAGGIWATTLAYGANHASARSPGGTPTAATTHAALLETSVTVAGRHTVFGRSEIAQMPAHDLHVLEYGTSVFAVGKLQIGYVRHRRATKGLVPGVGGTLSLSVLSPELAPRYSGRTARGFDIFLILQTSRHQM